MFLLVPIHIRALSLTSLEAVSSPLASYLGLPYFDPQSQQIINDATPYISDTVLSTPFQNLNLQLDAGIHLHWSLPSALTYGSSNQNDGLVMPALPNRWLIMRSGGNKTAKQWVVESDYLYPQDSSVDAIDMFYPTSGKENYQPYRFVGRQLELSEWETSRSSDDQYLPKLTVLGEYELFPELSDRIDTHHLIFTAFYPHSYSVFGLQDRDYTGNPPAGLYYDVIGWYSNSEKDFLYQFLNSYQQDHPDATNSDILAALKDQYDLILPSIPDGQVLPQKMLCYGRITFATDGNTPKDPSQNVNQSIIAVANTPVEALSAYMSYKYADKAGDAQNANIRRLVEDVFTAIELLDVLGEPRLDLEASFRQIRHQKEFSPHNGGLVWRVLPKSNSNSSQNANSNQNQVTLPDAIAHGLNALNLNQQNYDRAINEIKFLREQLFSDWYCFMLSRYDVQFDGQDTSLPNDDNGAIRSFIETQILPAISDKLQQTGLLQVSSPDESEGMNGSEDTVVTVGSFPNYPAIGNSLAQQTLRSFQDLKKLVDAYNHQVRFQMQFNNAPGSTTVLLAVEDSSQLVSDLKANYCLSFDGQQNYAKVTPLGSIQAISLWLKLPKDGQNISGCLIDAQNLRQGILSSSTWGNNWTKICINGEPKSISSWQRDWQALSRDEWLHLYLETGTSFDGPVYVMSDKTIAQHLKGQIASVCFHPQSLSADDILRNYQSQMLLLQTAYSLQSKNGDRFWEPNDPVVLMVGEAVQPSDPPTDIADGLNCQVLNSNLDLQNLPASTQTTLETWLNQQIQTNPSDSGFTKWTEQPWHPFLLDWSVQLYPIMRGDVPQVVDLIDYSSDCIQNRYDLGVNAIDLMPKPDTESRDEPAEGFMGTCLLSPDVFSLMLSKLRGYLNEQVMKGDAGYFKQQNISSDEQTDDYLTNNIASVISWYIGQHHLTNEPSQANAEDPNYVGLWSYQSMLGLEHKCLAQSLGGFNDALLNNRRSMQLPLADPIAFDIDEEDEGAFHRAVADVFNASYLSESLPRSPLIYNNFNPIREGGMQITGLRLIDLYGRTKSIINLGEDRFDVTIVAPTQMTSTRLDLYSVWLPPRLTQPANLSFRWLSANHQEEIEVNDHPATTPVCGWILPNNLDNSLFIFTNQGEALGYFDVNNGWKSVPGAVSRTLTQVTSLLIDRGNQALAQFLTYLSARGKEFLQDFLTVVDSALETIDPQSFAQFTGTALLMGRPIALVRAKLNLQLQTPPAINHSSTAFLDDLNRWIEASNDGIDFVPNFTRQTNGLSHVKYSIRVGDYHQLNDGLVGYWIEKQDGTYDQNIFYAPQSAWVQDGYIKTLYETEQDEVNQRQTPMNLTQTLEPESAQTLVMLVDPRCPVYATCGILPAMKVEIPSDQFAQVLQTLNVSFMTAPILNKSLVMPPNQPPMLNLSLPKETGFSWSWTNREADTWQVLPAEQIIDFSQDPAFKPQEVYEGWAQLQPNSN